MDRLTERLRTDSFNGNFGNQSVTLTPAIPSSVPIHTVAASLVSNGVSTAPVVASSRMNINPIASSGL